MGLPFLRTSPDHGTAYDLAGSGRASADSMEASILLAADMAGRGGAAPRKAQRATAPKKTARGRSARSKAKR